jgi:hypothetical protein
MLLHDHPAQPPAPGELPRSATYGEGFIGYEAERQAVRLKFETQEALLGLGYDIGEIDGIIGTKSFADFQDDPMLRSAVERQFEIIGEALAQLAKADPTAIPSKSRVNPLVTDVARSNGSAHVFQ